jgi:hypothetical protein
MDRSSEHKAPYQHNVRASGCTDRGTYLISSPLITQENAKEYYYPDSPF